MSKVEVWRESRNLARIFPERYSLYAKILNNIRGESGLRLVWKLMETRELSPTSREVAGNYNEHSTLGQIPLGRYQPCEWASLTEKDRVKFEN